MELVANSTADDTISTIWPNTGDTLPELSPHEKLVAAVAYVIIAVLGITGNSLVILAVVLSKKLQTITNIYVVALAVTDLLTAFIQILQAVMLLSKSRSNLLRDVCRIAAAVNFNLLGYSIVTLALIAINRMQVVTSKSSSRSKPTGNKAVGSIIILFLLTSLGCIATSFIDKITFGIVQEFGTCDYQAGLLTDMSVGLYIFFVLSVIIFCYARTYHHVRQHFRQVGHVLGGCPLRNSNHEHAATPTTGLQEINVDSTRDQESLPLENNSPITSSLSCDTEQVSKVTLNYPSNHEESACGEGRRIHFADMGASSSTCITLADIQKIDCEQVQRTEQLDISTVTGNLSVVAAATRLSTLPSGEALSQRSNYIKMPPSSKDISTSRYCYRTDIPHATRRVPLDKREELGMMVDHNDEISWSPTSSSVVSPSFCSSNQQILFKRSNDRKIKSHRAKIPKNAEAKITFNMLLLVVTFFACMMPSIVLLFLPGTQAYSWIGKLILFSNCCWNPLIYARKHPDFKHTFSCILRGKFSKIREPVLWLRRRIIAN